MNAILASMPSFSVKMPEREYLAHVERGLLGRIQEFVPAKTSRIFVVTTEDVWNHQGAALAPGLSETTFTKILLPGGEPNKRLAPLETAAEEMIAQGGDRQSVVIGFGGGIVTDMAGFLAAIFMRGIPVIQVPTTLLAQVDAAVGGKTGVNLSNGKNLVGSFHQPAAVVIDPVTVDTLPEREYRAGLYEVVKHGIIASVPLFRLMVDQRDAVLARGPEAVDEMIAESVRIKAAVVSADEREGGLRRILNFGHTFGHALEAETKYERFLHGEAVAWGMRAATHLAAMVGMLEDPSEILSAVEAYGPIPLLDGISAEALQGRLTADKKTVHGKVHFVLPTAIGTVEVRSGIDPALVRAAIEKALG
jgi:3-dehydroquinate synthase